MQNDYHTYSSSVKNNILKCATDIITTAGAREVTVTKVVKLCKISKTTFYKYFSSSKELVSTVQQQGIAGSSADFNTTRQAIIQKAREAFSQRPFHEIDLNSVAQAAGLKRTTIYNYFQSKEELLTVSFQEELENRQKFLEQIRQEPFHPLHSIHKLLEYGVDFSTKPYNNLMLCTILYDSNANAQMKQLWQSLYNCSQETIRTYFVKGKANGWFAPDIDVEGLTTLVGNSWLGLSLSTPEQYLQLGEQFITLLIVPMLQQPPCENND